MRCSSLIALFLHTVVIDGRAATSTTTPSPSSVPMTVDIPFHAFRQQRRLLLQLLAEVANASPLLPAPPPSSAVCFTVTGLVRRQSPEQDVDVEIVLQRPRVAENLTGPILCRTADDSRARLVRVRDAARLMGWDTANDSATISRLEKEEAKDEMLYNIRSEGRSSRIPGLSKTQKSVIYICSAVIGIFFLIAASLRFRNYLQRKASFRKLLRCDSPLRVRRFSSVRPSRRGRRLTEKIFADAHPSEKTRLDTGLIDVDDGEVIKYLSATEQERRVQIEDVPTTYQIPSRRRRCSCPHDACCASFSVPPHRSRSRFLSASHSPSPIRFCSPQPLPTVSRSSSTSQLPTALPLPHVDLPNASPRRAHAPVALLPAATAAAALAPAGLLSCRCRMATLGWTCAHRRFYQRMMNPLYDPSLRHEEKVREERLVCRRVLPSNKVQGLGKVGQKVMEEDEEDEEEESEKRTNAVKKVRVDVCPEPPEEVGRRETSTRAAPDPPQRPSTAASV